MDEFIDTVIAFDSKGDMTGLMNYFNKNRPTIHELLLCLQSLLRERHFSAAYLLSMSVHGRAREIVLIQLVQAAGGLLFDNLEDEANGIEGLGRAVDALPPSERDSFYTDVVRGTTTHLLNIMWGAKDLPRVMRVLKILQAAVPRMRAVFDLDAEPTPIDLRQMRARIIDFHPPAPGSARRPHRGVVAIRNAFVSQKPDSRILEVNACLVFAMQSYGWHAVHYPIMACSDFESEYREIAALCEHEQADLLFFDDHVFIDKDPVLHGRNAMITQLRQTLPDLKVVAIHFDPWMLPESFLVEILDAVDAVWTCCPHLPIWRHSGLWNKAIFAPLPKFGIVLEPSTPIAPRMRFRGGIKGYNWHRMFWMAASLGHGLPIEWQLSTHMADGLSPQESYAVYMKETAGSGCTINFGMRPDMTSMATGRSFEALAAGTLLVQEASDDMDYYFIAGEHYIEFSTFSDVRAIFRFLETNPEEAEDIRRRGFEFSKQHYSDENIIGNLERVLFFPEQ